ncbi:MAG: hypothetical protein FWD48_05300 [Oscillospiraceae bacterium]|nr:hypothetical protein [Oscillospiraceae bacterium]
MAYFDKGDKREAWKKELEELNKQRGQKPEKANESDEVKKSAEPIKEKEAEKTAEEKLEKKAQKEAVAAKPLSSKRVAITFEQLEADAFGKSSKPKLAEKAPALSKTMSKTK